MNLLSRRFSEDDPLSPTQSSFLLQQQERALATLLYALSLIAPLVTLGVFQREGASPLMWVGLTLTLAIWIGLVAFRRRQVRLAAHLVVLTILAASMVGIAVHGTVRSSAVMVMFAGVVGAGSFLPRSTMIASAAVSVLALAVLNWLENNGHLPTPNLQTGWAVWVTQTGVLVSVLVSVFHGRNRMRHAFVNQEVALARAQAVQTELRASENRFMSLFRNNPAATIVQRVQTREVLDINDAFERMFGHARANLLGQAPPTLWADPVDQLAYRERLQADGRVEGLRSRGRRANGEAFEMLISGEFVTEGSDKLIISLVLDVSGEESSRLALQQSEERFSKAFHFSPIGMTITRIADGRFMEVNAANQRVLGYSQADFANRTSLEAGVWVTEAERQAYIGTLQRDGRLLGYETRMRNKLGEAVPVRVWSEIVELNAEPCALAFTMNIRDEKQREAMLINVAEGVSGETGEAFFRSLTEHLARAIGADGVMVGELIPDQLQIASLALQWQGRRLPQVRYDLQHTACEQALNQTELFVCEQKLGERFSLLPELGEAQPQAYAGLSLRDADGTPIGLMVAMWVQAKQPDAMIRALMSIFASRCSAELVRLRRDREILKLHETLEQRVQQRTAQLEYLNRELDSFAYSVSHDLKSPLRSIGGFSHLLREQLEPKLEPDDVALFDRVDASVQRMTGLITDLLALARVSQGNLARSQVNLSEMAEEVVQLERQRHPERQVDVQVDAGLSAHCDPRLARIVLDNLIGNAWKYTRQQAQARISLQALPRAAGQPPVFCIRDNGAGFDMGRADRLFKPFNRLHASNEFEGSGIGLATVRRILERHNGHVSGRGEVGASAEFEFSFGNEASP